MQITIILFPAVGTEENAKTIGVKGIGVIRQFTFFCYRDVLRLDKICEIQEYIGGRCMVKMELIKVTIFHSDSSAFLKHPRS